VQLQICSIQAFPEYGTCIKLDHGKLCADIVKPGAESVVKHLRHSLGQRTLAVYFQDELDMALSNLGARRTVGFSRSSVSPVPRSKRWLLRRPVAVLDGLAEDSVMSLGKIHFGVRLGSWIGTPASYQPA
jgi:hypothetical protein